MSYTNCSAKDYEIFYDTFELAGIDLGKLHYNDPFWNYYNDLEDDWEEVLEQRVPNRDPYIKLMTAKFALVYDPEEQYAVTSLLCSH